MPYCIVYGSLAEGIEGHVDVAPNESFLIRTHG